jgi:hypothetical protein
MATSTKQKKSVQPTVKKHYDTTLQLHCDDDAHRWKFGDLPAEIWLTPAYSPSPHHNINSILINVRNRYHSPLYRNFMLGFDSIGLAPDGREIIHTSFPDAYDQLQINKVKAEQFLGANLDISALKDLRPLVLEFERRSAAHSAGFDGLQF